MAKRANPYVEDFIQQCKTHVGIKQFNNNKERLQEVYEKTLDILFKGAKKPYQCSTVPLTPSDTKDRFKQLFISCDGSLQHSGQMFQKQDVGRRQCKCGTAEAGVCAYCETSLCLSCEHVCSRCRQLFCRTCSLVVCEGSEVCVSCYG